MQVSIGNIPLPLVEELNLAPNIFGITAVTCPTARQRGSHIQIALSKSWWMRKQKSRRGFAISNNLNPPIRGHWQ
jgi:hypothetical protein